MKMQKIRCNSLFWLIVFVSAALVAEELNHKTHTLRSILSLLAILAVAVPLSPATENQPPQDRSACQLNY
jgi:hypothetical protein